MIEYELTKCAFCHKMKKIMVFLSTERRNIKICLECHTAREKNEEKNYGTHDPKRGIFD